MSIIESISVRSKQEQTFEQVTPQMQSLKDRADRFSERRAFETVREMHGLPTKEEPAKKPK